MTQGTALSENSLVCADTKRFPDLSSADSCSKRFDFRVVPKSEAQSPAWANFWANNRERLSSASGQVGFNCARAPTRACSVCARWDNLGRRESGVENLLGRVSTAEGRPSGSFSPRPEMLEIPEDASRVMILYPMANILVSLSPVSREILAEAKGLETDRTLIDSDTLRRWSLPVLGPIFRHREGNYRLARLDDVVIEVTRIEETERPSDLELTGWIKTELMGLRWTGADWVPVGASPYADLGLP